MKRWLEANKAAEKRGDWSQMAELYTEDAEYTWNLGPNEEFVARGREEIRKWALGTEMEGLDGWTYPYLKVLIDDKEGEIVAFWKQISPIKKPDGSNVEVKGVGGSWFRYGGDYKWCWQRDFFDLGNVMAVFMELMQNGQLSDAMKRRVEKAMSGELVPGHVKAED